MTSPSFQLVSFKNKRIMNANYIFIFIYAMETADFFSFSEFFLTSSFSAPFGILKRDKLIERNGGKSLNFFNPITMLRSVFFCDHH